MSWLLKLLIWQTRSYILIFFLYEKDSQICWTFLCTFQEKSKEPIRYVVVRKTPKNFWTSHNFPESNASAPARYFSLCRGYPLPIIFFKCFFLPKMLACFSFVSVLLFALVERLCFSRMQDFFYSLYDMKVSHIL